MSFITTLSCKDDKSKLQPYTDEQLQALASLIPSPLFVYQHYKFVYVNPSMEGFCGYNAYELYNLDYIWDIVAPEQSDMVKERVVAREQGKEVISNYELMIKSKPGEIKWLDFSGSIIEYKGRLAVLAFGIDITDRKQAEKEKLDRERELSNLMNNLVGMVFYCENDKYWTTKFVSNGSLELTGYSPLELIDNKAVAYSDIIHPNDREIYETVEEAIKSQSQYAIEYRIITKDKEIKYVFERGQGVFNPDGSLYRLEGLVVDISERKRAEEELRAAYEQMEAALEELMAIEDEVRRQYQQLQEQEHFIKEAEQRLADIINFLPDPTLVINQLGEVLFWNRAMEAITGIPKENIIGRGNYEYALPFFGQRCPILVDMVLRPDEDYSKIENRYRFANRELNSLSAEAFSPNIFNNKGAYLWGVASRLYNLENVAIGAIQTIRDITTHKRAERELQMAKEEAEQANLAKSQFLANMSHEIRTPMNGIMGMTELVLMGDLTPEQREYLNLAKSSSQVLLRVISDILDYSKIEVGYINLEQHPFSILKIVNEVMSLFIIVAQQKGLILDTFIDERIPEYLIGDSVRLRQVLSNLIGNAVKFTFHGSINMDVWYMGSENDQVRLRFVVSDTGIGITEENLDKLFKRFSQVDDSSKKQFGGTGLGLAISKSLVEMMGGTIGVESNFGKGSKFFFSAFFGCQESRSVRYEEPRENLSKLGLQSRNILLVEDDEVSIYLAVKILRQNGLEVTVANNGQEAVELFSQSEYDLIIMDVNMPIMDGYAATTAIRRSESFSNRHTPIIAMTAYAQQGDREECINAGMDDYLGKPIDIQEMNAILDKWLA